MGLFDKAPEGADVERLARDVHSALSELRNALENKSTDTAENVQAFLSDYEEKVAQPRARQLALMRQDLDAVHKTLAHGAPLDRWGNPDWSRSGYGRDSDHYRDFFKWFQEKSPDQVKVLQRELKTLRTDQESAGGYLVPEVMDAQIKKNILEISPVRAHARLRIAYQKAMTIPRRLSAPIAQYEGEAETGATDQSIYGSEQITCYRQTVTVPATLDMMVSSAFDLEQEIAFDVGESFGQGEGLNFVKGNGRKSPQGIISDTRVVSYTSTNSASIVWSDLASIAGEVKRGYEPWFFMNRKTLAYLQALTSSIGVPIWQPVAGNTPATIWGWPYDSRMIALTTWSRARARSRSCLATCSAATRSSTCWGSTSCATTSRGRKKRSRSGRSVGTTPAG